MALNVLQRDPVDHGMKRLSILALGISLLAGGATFGHAQRYEDTGRRHSGKQIVETLQRHEERIREGEHSGELTHKEAAELRSKEDFYRAKLDDFLHRNGGFLYDNEEFSLEDSLKKMSDQIYGYKHNNAVR